MQARVPDVRRALTDKVAQRVAGRGIPRAVVEEAVSRVLAALPGEAGIREGGGTQESSVASSRPSNADRERQPTVVAALAARSVPDLASRVRRDLERDGVVLEQIGLGRAGQHTVVTIRVPASARPALERLAERTRYALSFLSGADVGATVE